MTRKQVWSYQCDHCKVRKYSLGAISKHEASCTANPNRVCRMHRYFEKDQRPVVELCAALSLSLPDGGMAALRKLAGGCPACILAAIRQSKVCASGPVETFTEAPKELVEFSFKTEVKALWESVNVDREYHP